MSVQNVKRILLGTPIATAHAAHERLGPLTGLAIFASDALSSVAYATEEILLILILAGSVALEPRVPHRDRHRRPDRDRRELVPADDPRVPDGRRVYVVTRENLGRVPEPRRGRRAAGRLRPHGRRQRRRRHRRDHVRHPAAVPLPRDAVRDRRGPHRGRQPPRGAGIGPALRGAHLPVPRLLRRPARLGRGAVAPGRRRAVPPRVRPRSEAPRPSSSSCGPSRRAARP